MTNDIATRQDNLKIWESVSQTSPGSTKGAKVNGMQITVIDGYAMLRKATEIFGPLGIGWGYEVMEERWDEGAPFYVNRGEGVEDDRLVALTHTIKLKLWYKWNGERGEIEQYGHTQAVYRSKWGASDDGEAPKKSLMDAIKKSLSMLGFSADIFTGQYDDVEYRNQLIAEEEIEKAEDRDAEIEKKQTELTDYVKRNLEAINKATTASEVKGVVKGTARHLERQKAIHCLTRIAEHGLKAVARDSETKLKELEQPK